jgi:hypothetical protein
MRLSSAIQGVLPYLREAIIVWFQVHMGYEIPSIIGPSAAHRSQGKSVEMQARTQ